MKNERSFLELLNMASENYKQKLAIKIAEEKNSINYYSYKFEIMALKNSINKILTNTKNVVVIISENRYEWISTYLANIIAGNDVVILSNSLKAEMISKIIEKYQVNTIFYSSVYRSKIIKINEYRRQKNDLKPLNLINFDKEKSLLTNDYNRIMNTGRYIENITQDDSEEKSVKEGKTIIATANKEKIFDSEAIIKEALKIKKKLHIWSITTRKIVATQYMQSQFDICVQIVVPLLLGIGLNYELKKSKIKDLVIQKSNIDCCEICKGKNVYKIFENENDIKISVSKRRKMPQLEVITNENFEKKKVTQNFILIK